MERMEERITSPAAESVQEQTVTCSRCGHLLRHPSEWIRGENGTIICARCYQEILFPNTHFYAMEVFD
jgi:formylmethanofuran dehydrogenase subunit E